ncbi:putative sugar ABC transporter ATP-binding protein [Nocardia brasiliensis NBRC 14402]|uniref:ATP-binding cassette domain-containing protein n=1 Tax=Nocardia brasiliensis TaxID=37326 RepID=UPI00045C4108|nr:ATP-binding cassette domain-containing protein [Nocardia brasiliensis]ASF08287.1 sugar ABC transporter ATP-binding protein [Nocardia brasiliensis]GAJ79959.1 putative sugar ABC transporter ATP-binding protein [Nocardia brasiliensis NBRC 14402]SUB41258.1 Galactose/methyl galactoside import ATP-binding protein MglA [Nocardia brasiliensis]
MTKPMVEAHGLTKSFDSVRALDGVSLTIPEGEVTALVGDNGAGKSTLVRCLTGVHPPDTGEILFRGAPVRLGSPEDARRMGIETVYQDLALIDDLAVWQNLFLNRELVHRIWPLKILNRTAMIAQSVDILRDLDVDVPSVRTTVRRMSGGQRQSIAIARAVAWGKAMVIMDEPTAALGVRETAAVEKLVRGLRDRGVTVLIISHDLAQVMRICDNVVVLRRGRSVAAHPVREIDGDRLVALITGAAQGNLEASAAATTEVS